MLSYSNIRVALPITGKRVVEVTCEDWEDVVRKYPDPEDRISKVYVHFEDGSTLAFYVSERTGFDYDGHAQQSQVWPQSQPSPSQSDPDPGDVHDDTSLR